MEEDDFEYAQNGATGSQAEEEVGLPRAALNKLIRDTLPSGRIANETKDVLYQCCLEFIRVVSAQANQFCEQDARKTISHEHILRALEILGFDEEYLEAGRSVLTNCEQVAARRQRRQNSRLDKLGIPEEELLRQQQELFQKAREEQAACAQQELSIFLAQCQMASAATAISSNGLSSETALSNDGTSLSPSDDGSLLTPSSPLSLLTACKMLPKQNSLMLASDALDEDYDAD